MGNACCVAARDKMVVPNRGRVPGKDTSLSWLSSHGISPNDSSDLESESSFLSSQGSPLDNYQTQKSTASDQSFSRNPSIDTVSEQIIQNPVSSPSPAKRSVSFASSPLSSHSHPQMPPTLKVAPRTRLSKQVSDGQILGFNSPSRSSATEERLGKELHYEPSDAWSMQAFSEMMVYSRRESCFYDKIDHQGNRKSSDHQTTCGACSRSLSQKSLLGSQKIFATDELSVAAILVCGHVYHSECLEKMTPEKDMFDPPCPVCTFGEKRMFKLSEKALRDDLDSRAKLNKRLRKGAVDNNDFVMLDHRNKGIVSKLVKSSSLRSYSPKPFLARHFSFGSRSNSIKSPKENQSTTSLKKKGFFWTKSSKL